MYPEDFKPVETFNDLDDKYAQREAQVIVTAEIFQMNMLCSGNDFLITIVGIFVNNSLLAYLGTTEESQRRKSETRKKGIK